MLSLVAVIGLGQRNAHAQQPVPREADDPPRIELYTIGPAEEVWSMFGHSALCVIDARDPDGRCYNYGTGSFANVTELITSFMHRNAMFWVSTQTLVELIEGYRTEDRAVYRQVLPLSDGQARAMAARLEADWRKPDHGPYAYDHRYDNCTTRVRDQIDAVMGGSLRKAATARYGPTWHEILGAGFAADWRLAVLGEILMARAAEDRPSQYEALMLPGYLRVRVWGLYGAVPELIYERQGPPVEGPPHRGRQAVGVAGLVFAAFIGLLIALGTVTRRRWIGRIGLVMLGLGLGVLGAVVWTLMLYSHVPDLSWNEVAVLLVPTDLALVALRGRWLRGYLNVRIAMVALTILAAATGLFIQPLVATILLAGLPLACARAGLVGAANRDLRARP